VVKGSVSFKSLKVVLTEGFIQDDSGGIAEVDGSLAFHHRDTDAVFLMVDQNLFGNPAALGAEHDEVVHAERHFRVDLMGFGGCKPYSVSFRGFAEVFIVFMDHRLQSWPVVEAGPSDIFICNLKSKGLDQVEPCSGDYAGPSDVSGIIRYLRFIQYDIDHGFSSLQSVSFTDSYSITKKETII